MEDARGHQVEIIVAEILDCLSRDQEDGAGLFKQLSFLGIKLMTLAEGEISELHVGFNGAMNALYLKDLAQKTHRGLEGRVRTRTDAAGILRNLIDETRLIPRDGQLDIYLVGNLAEILDLCAKKNPGSKGDGVQITLVAGARNRLCGLPLVAAMSSTRSSKWEPKDRH